jgi:hypothetical protein
MTGSACISSAETAAGEVGLLTQGGKKPRASDKPVKLTAKAYTDLKTYATEKGLDLKTVASEAIHVYCASQGSKAELLLLRAKINRVTDRMLDKIEKACEGETLELDVVKALGPLAVKFIHEIPRLSALLEESSMSERIPFDWDDADAEAEKSAVK